MRALRRTFAASVVLVSACKTSSPPIEESHNPPAPNPPSPTNPPPPTANPPGPDPLDTPPPKPPEPVHDNPPKPNNDVHWEITKKAGKCTAFFLDSCRDPNRKPGDPIPPCNPPVPTDYKCQAAVTDDSYRVIKREGETKCFLDYTCPANAKCKAPPELDCPR